ncbi:MAG: hypothetical protein ACO3DJ_14005, partial [Alphaproteobacteria bacterium]
MLQQPGFAEDLQHAGMMRRLRERLLERGLPRLARDVAAKRDPPRAPGGLVEPADLEDQFPLALGGGGQLPPVVERPPADQRPVEHRPGRQGRGIDDPRGRDQGGEDLPGAGAEGLGPEVPQPGVMEQGERELLLLEGAQGRGDGD